MRSRARRIKSRRSKGLGQKSISIYLCILLELLAAITGVFLGRSRFYPYLWFWRVSGLGTGAKHLECPIGLSCGLSTAAVS